MTFLVNFGLCVTLGLPTIRRVVVATCVLMLMWLAQPASTGGLARRPGSEPSYWVLICAQDRPYGVWRKSIVEQDAPEVAAPGEAAEGVITGQHIR